MLDNGALNFAIHFRRNDDREVLGFVGRDKTIRIMTFVVNHKFREKVLIKVAACNS